MMLTIGTKYDVGSLNFTGWTSTGTETAHDGYSAYDYFDQDGTYLGEDEFGIEPTAEAGYTEDGVREYIESHDDNCASDPAELLSMFQSIYERAPDEDEKRDMWSWICCGVSHA